MNPISPNKPKIGVIMSTYNAAGHLDECFRSLADQTFRDFVVHIVDDNSRDDTPDIISRWCGEDSRFKLIGRNVKNQGLTKSLNHLLAVTDTEYIARIDADDIAMPNRLERQARFLDHHTDISVVGSWALEVDEQGRDGAIRSVAERHEDIGRMILRVNPMIHPSVMFRRSDIVRIGGYNVGYRTAQDYALWFACLENGLKLANIPEPLIRYRLSSGHMAKRGLSYRKRDAAVRWHGAKALGCGPSARLTAAAIPIALGIVPGWARKLALRHRDRLDPRHAGK